MTHASAEINWTSKSSKDEGVEAGEKRHVHRQAEKGQQPGPLRERRLCHEWGGHPGCPLCAYVVSLVWSRHAYCLEASK